MASYLLVIGQDPCQLQVNGPKGQLFSLLLKLFLTYWSVIIYSEDTVKSILWRYHLSIGLCIWTVGLAREPFRRTLRVVSDPNELRRRCYCEK